MDGFWDVPCVECIVYAACKSKKSIQCEILYTHFKKKFPMNWNKMDQSLASRSQINDYLVYLNKRNYCIFQSIKSIKLTN